MKTLELYNARKMVFSGEAHAWDEKYFKTFGEAKRFIGKSHGIISYGDQLSPKYRVIYKYFSWHILTSNKQEVEIPENKIRDFLTGKYL